MNSRVATVKVTGERDERIKKKKSVHAQGASESEYFIHTIDARSLSWREGES